MLGKYCTTEQQSRPENTGVSFIPKPVSLTWKMSKITPYKVQNTLTSVERAFSPLISLLPA